MASFPFRGKTHWHFAPKPPNSGHFVFCCRFRGGAPVLQCNTRFSVLLKAPRHKKMRGYFLSFCRGAFSRTRTYDPAVNSRMLYRLSYKGSQRDYYINICRAICQEFLLKITAKFLLFSIVCLCAAYRLPFLLSFVQRNEQFL